MTQIDVSGFDVPAYQQQDNKGLDQLVATTARSRDRKDALMQRQQEFNEREKDRQTANEYRLANMISSGTDLSPHLTGDQIANNFATQELSKALPEFSAMAKSGASPIDLQAAINNKMSMLTPALDNIKQEYSQGDAVAKKMAAIHPNFNTEQFLNDYRNDVHSRTVDDKGQLIPSQLVKQSQFQNQLTNPDLMSKYVSGANGIIKAINDPKNHEEVSAFVGTPDSHMKYDAKKGYWQQENYAPTDIQNGFLKNGTQPHLQVKSEILPMNQLPPEVNQNKPFQLLDKSAYNTFIQEPNVDLELRQLTRQQYPQYDKFNEQEKEYARRNMAYNMLSGLTQHDFHEGAFTKASRQNININNSNPDQYIGIASEHFDEARNNNPHTVYNSNAKSNETWGKLPLDLGAKTMAYNALTGQNTSVPYDAYYVTPSNKVVGVTYPRDKKTNKPIEGSTFDKQDVLSTKDYVSKLLQQRGVPQKSRIGATDINVKELGGNSGSGNTPKTIKFKDAKGNIYSVPENSQDAKELSKIAGVKQVLEDGMTQSNNITDHNWEVVKNIKGNSHADGGVDVSVQGQTVNAEGGELKLRNKVGQVAIIPKNLKERVLGLLRAKKNKEASAEIEKLPISPNKADEGGLYDEDTSTSIAEDGGSFSGDDTKKKVSVVDPMIQQKIDYVNSPIYKQRLIEQGESNPNNLIQQRLDLLNKTQIFNSQSQGVQANTTNVGFGTPTVHPQIILAKGDSDVTKAHELGHVTSSLDNEPVTSANTGKPMQMSPYEAWKFVNSNKNITPSQKQDTAKKYQQEAESGIGVKKFSTDPSAQFLAGNGDTHQIGAGENKADLDALRYLFKREGLTKSYGEDITPDILKKAAEHKNIKNEPHFKRMLSNFGTDGIIKLNNTIAYQPSNTNQIQA